MKQACHLVKITWQTLWHWRYQCGEEMPYRVYGTPHWETPSTAPWVPEQGRATVVVESSVEKCFLDATSS